MTMNVLGTTAATHRPKSPAHDTLQLWSAILLTISLLAFAIVAATTLQATAGPCRQEPVPLQQYC